jgi:hypothetical protein
MTPRSLNATKRPARKVQEQGALAPTPSSQFPRRCAALGAQLPHGSGSTQRGPCAGPAARTPP